MATFSEVVKGTRVVKRVVMPRPEGYTVPEGVQAPSCDLRALNGLEEQAALTSARTAAIAAGVDDPKPGNPIFDLALMVERLLLACRDPEDNDKPYFDGGSEQLRQYYGRDGIALLYELQEQQQEETSPSIARFDAEDLIRAAALEMTREGPEGAEQALTFFLRLRPGLRVTLVRTLAHLHLSSLVDRSDSGSLSANNTQTTNSKPSKSGGKAQKKGR